MIALLSALLLAMPACGSGSSPGPPPPPLQPKTYASTSGTWRLDVDPTSRRGAGPGRYRLTRNGVEAWSGERPLTLWEAVVSEEGFCAGFAYTQGCHSGPDHGEFVVVIHDPAGATVYDERHPRYSTMHGAANPVGLGVYLHDGLDRVTVSIPGRDEHGGYDEWWSYRMSTGEWLGKIWPDEQFGLPPRQRTHGCVAARGVPGTPLTISQWLLRKCSVRFVLLDEDLAPVWKLDVPGDYSVPGDEFREAWLWNHVRANGLLPPSAEPNRFHVQLVRDRTLATFEVQEAEGADSYSVTAVSRRWSTPPEPDPSPTRIALRRLGSEPLREGEPRWRVPKRDLGEADVAPASPARWIAFTEGYDVEEVRRLSATGEVLDRIDRRPDGRWFEDIEDLAVARDGGVAVLDGGHGLEGRNQVVAFYSAQGQPLRTLRLPWDRYVSRLSLGEGWLVAHGNRPAAVLVDLLTARTVVVECAAFGEAESSWTFGLSPDETELWAVESDPPALHRFALPR